MNITKTTKTSIKDFSDSTDKLNKNKTTDKYRRAYIINPDGSQSTRTLRQEGEANTIAERDNNGCLGVNAPKNNNHATTKLYVDDAISNLIKHFVMQKHTITSLTSITINTPGIYILQGLNKSNITLQITPSGETEIHNTIALIVSINSTNENKLDAFMVGVSIPTLSNISNFFKTRWLYKQDYFDLSCSSGIDMMKTK